MKWQGLLALGALALAACTTSKPKSEPAPSASASPRSSIEPPRPEVEQRRGMRFIAGGPLVAGTPAGQLPRLVDREMRGEQLIMKGFYIDVFPYPNEEGAIPLTNVTQQAAAKSCEDQSKRLCGELEWERACKGPENTTFEYGDAYRADRCGTGLEPLLRPSGLRVACRSDFDVHDMHGGAFEWTRSAWGRGSSGSAVSVRGGNGLEGQVVARCAHAEPRAASQSSPFIGFRCCAGSENTSEVVLQVRAGETLEMRGTVDKELARSLLRAQPAEVRDDLTRFGQLRVEMFWLWRPIANEELYAARICAGGGKFAGCGISFVRIDLGRLEVLGFASSGVVPATLHLEGDAVGVWVQGGDGPGPFRRWVAYRYGEIDIGPPERRVGKASRTQRRKHKG